MNPGGCQDTLTTLRQLQTRIVLTSDPPMIRKTRLYHYVVYGVRDSAVLIFSLFLLGAIAVLILEVRGKLKLPEFVDDAEEVTRSTSLEPSTSEMTTTTTLVASTQTPLETG